jgi:hypothetical protein
MSTADASRAGDDGPREWPLLELTGQARDLLTALTEKKAEAGSLYAGALRVLADRQNPARVRLAACGLRELLDEFHEAPKGEKLGERVKKLKERWEVASRSSGAAPGGEGDDFAQALNEFFAAYERDFPGRRQQASETIKRHDPSGRTPPPTVHRARGEAWMAYSGYFSGVLHGDRQIEEAFMAELNAFERFLLDWLRPETFKDYTELDQLLAEGPPDV